MCSSINSAKICGHLVFGKTWKVFNSMPRKTFPVQKLLRQIELGHFSHFKNPYFNQLLKTSLLACFAIYKNYNSVADLGVLIGDGKHLAGQPHDQESASWERSP